MWEEDFRLVRSTPKKDHESTLSAATYAVDTRLPLPQPRPGFHLVTISLLQPTQRTAASPPPPLRAEDDRDAPKRGIQKELSPWSYLYRNMHK